MTQTPDIVPEGLPDHLPEGERLVWQGRPDWKLLAVNVFHVRKIVLYFGLIIAGQAAMHLANGSTVAEALDAVPVLLALALAGVGVLAALAYASARTTHYTLTTKRALMKIGIALPVIINIPFRQIDGVSFAVTGGNRGNLVFKTGGEIRLAYLLLWPHARPWQLKKPQPAFRDIPEVEAVASRLAFLLGGQVPQEALVPANDTGHILAAE